MKAYELLDHEARWTKYASGRDDADNPIDPASHYARKWCMLGALVRCYASPDTPEDAMTVSQAVERLEQAIGDSSISITYANDYSDTTFEKVQEWLRKADV